MSVTGTRAQPTIAEAWLRVGLAGRALAAQSLQELSACGYLPTDCAWQLTLAERRVLASAIVHGIMGVAL